MRRIALWVFAAVLLVPSIVSAQSTPGYRLKVRTFAELANEQRRIVLGYCRADFEGARLVTNGFEKMRSFVSYRVNPEFATVQVVSRFEVPLPEQPGDVVSANYRMVGLWDTHAGWSAQTGSQNVEFRIIEREGDLMINEIEPGQPRVSPRAALAYLKQQLASANSDIEKSMIQKGIDALTIMVAPAAAPASAAASKP
ncbi:MAG TPA: hypothetical protein VF786_12010 [Terriglobales bacterium]